MKHTKLTTVVAALAFTAIVGASAARAQSAGDLILGFEEPGSGGSANVYEVDLGSASLFASSQTFNLSASDLSTEFGSGWATSSLLQFGVIGGTQTSGDLTLGSQTYAKDTLFVTQNTFAAVPSEHVSSTQATAQGDINALYNDVQNVGTPTSGSTASLPAVSTDSSDPGSIAYQNAHKSNFNLGTGFAKSDLDFNSDGTTSAPTSATLDLYELTPTDADTGAKATDLLGQFSLGSGGVLTFTSAAAVPEPSAYTLGLTAIVLFFVLKRRQSIGQA